MYLFFIIIIPFIGTVIGASIVFLTKQNMNDFAKKLLVGFSAGVMLGASLWSLLLPSIQLSKNNNMYLCYPTIIGFVGGIFLLLLIDKIFLPLLLNKKSYSHKNILMILAVTLHNIPEGIAIGVTLASLIYNNSLTSISTLIILIFGITIQNIPEGTVVTTPLLNNGMSKKKAFIYGIFTGIIEPIFSIITLIFTSFTVPILPYLLAFAAGAMVYVITVDLIPESQVGKYSSVGTIALTIGFVLMMIMELVFN